VTKIVDPDQLNQSTEVVLNTGAKTIQLLVAGNLNDTAPGKTSGVIGQAVYSFLKEEWKTDNALNKFRFPIQMIYDASFILINGWTFADQTSIDLLRDAGFQYIGGTANTVENSCIVTLGNMDAPLSDLAYYQNVTGTTEATVFDQTVTSFHNTGELNENIEVYDSAGTDYRSYLKVFLREQGKTFASYSLLSEQGLAALTYATYRLPLSNGSDLKIVDNDTAVGSGTGSESGVTYSELSVDYLVGNSFTTASLTGGVGTDGIYAVDDVVQDGNGRWAICTAIGTAITSITAYASFGGTSTWVAYAGEREIGTGNYFAFNRIIDADDVSTTSARTAEIHTWAQYQLRQNADINANTNGDIFGTVKGNIAVDLTGFIGDTLATNPGTYIDNFDVNDQNSIEFYDITVTTWGVATGGLDAEWIPNTSTKRTFPFVAAGNFNFSSNFTDELQADTRYVAYFAYTEQYSGATFATTASAGLITTITDSGNGFDLTAGDYIFVSGFAASENNGLYLETGGSPAAGTITVTKQDGVNPSDETLGATVTINENPFESPNAIIVDNNAGTDIDGQIDVVTKSWDYDYDGNTQRGNVAFADVPIIVVAIADDFAQWISVNHTITRTTGQNISVNAVSELNYSNP